MLMLMLGLHAKQLIKQLYERCGVSEARVASLIAEQQEAARNATLQLQVRCLNTSAAPSNKLLATWQLAVIVIYSVVAEEAH